MTNNMTPRAYFQQLITEGYEAHHAAALVNARFGG